MCMIVCVYVYDCVCVCVYDCVCVCVYQCVLVVCHIGLLLETNSMEKTPS